VHTNITDQAWDISVNRNAIKWASVVLLRISPCERSCKHSNSFHNKLLQFRDWLNNYQLPNHDSASRRQPHLRRTSWFPRQFIKWLRYTSSACARSQSRINTVTALLTAQWPHSIVRLIPDYNIQGQRVSISTASLNNQPIKSRNEESDRVSDWVAPFSTELLFLWTLFIRD
jgi:hypothetical protein